jgi:hypothetical protein
MLHDSDPTDLHFQRPELVMNHTYESRSDIDNLSRSGEISRPLLVLRMQDQNLQVLCIT